MNMIAFMDALTCFFFLLILIFWSLGWKRKFPSDSRIILGFLFVFTLVDHTLNFLEWSGYSDALNEFEDFIGILQPVLWSIFFYSFLQFITREKIEKSEKRYRLLFEKAGDAIFVVDTQTGTYLDANQAAAALTGRTISEIKKLKTFDISPAGTEETLQQFSEIKERIDFEEVTYLKPDGTERTAVLSIIPVGENEVFGIAHDITERKEAEEAIQRTNEELEQLVQERTVKLESTNEELQAFSYSVSHDLRAPLRAISGFSSILQEEFSNVLDEEGKEYLEIIITSSQKMEELIEGMLILSRLGQQDLQLQKIDMSHLASQVFEKLIVLEPDREIEFVVSENITATTDAQLMEILMTNLFSNAIKFTRDCPKAVIEFGCTDEAEAVQAFFVRDNGIGFQMQYAEKLFAPFQRLHSPEKYKGTGIGLAIVKRIIQRFNGKIWGESAPGQGACFYFTLGKPEDC